MTHGRQSTGGRKRRREEGTKRKRRRARPVTNGGAGQLTARAVRDLRWTDGLLAGVGRLGRSRLVLGDKSPWVAGELCALWRGDGPGQGWANLFVESVDSGVVTKAVWLRGGRPASGQTKRLMSLGKMRCLRVIHGEREVAEHENGDAEEDAAQAGAAEAEAAAAAEEAAEAGAAQAEAAAAAEEATQEVADEAADEGDAIAEGGMQVDRRYWCVDDRVDWSSLERQNSRLEPLVLPTRLEDESAQFRAAVVSRAATAAREAPRVACHWGTPS